MSNCTKSPKRETRTRLIWKKKDKMVLRLGGILNSIRLVFLCRCFQHDPGSTLFHLSTSPTLTVALRRKPLSLSASFKLKAGKGMMPPDGADVSEGETSQDEVKQTNGPKEELWNTFLLDCFFHLFSHP